MITSDIVEQACSEVSSYSDDRMMEEFDRFFKEQPALCDFVVELTQASSRQIQEMSLFLSYMVYKAAQMDSPSALGEIDMNRIAAAYQESERWMDLIGSAVDGAPLGETPGALPPDSEPHLIQYIISEINQPMEDGALLEDEAKGEVFFILKTVISSLSRRPIGKETAE